MFQKGQASLYHHLAVPHLLPATSEDHRVPQHKSSEDAAKEHILQGLAPVITSFSGSRTGEWHFPGGFLPPSAEVSAGPSYRNRSQSGPNPNWPVGDVFVSEPSAFVRAEEALKSVGSGEEREPEGKAGTADRQTRLYLHHGSRSPGGTTGTEPPHRSHWGRFPSTLAARGHAK